MIKLIVEHWRGRKNFKILVRVDNFFKYSKKRLAKCMNLVWSEHFKNSLESPYRLARSRTLDFHSKNRGSNPRGDARGF